MSVTSPLPQTAIPLAQPSALTRWYVLIMMVGVYSLSIADRYVVSTVLEPIRLDLNLTDAGVARLTGWALGIFYVLFGFPISWLVDRFSRRNLIMLSVVGWSLATTACGFATNYWQFFAARVGVGIGEAGGTPGASSILSDYFPADRRPMALAIFALGASIGAWIGLDVAAWIVDRYDWRTVFICFGVPGILFGFFLWLTVREPRRGQLDHNLKSESPSFAETMRYLWSQKSAVHLMSGSAVTALWGWGLMWWTPAFLTRTYGLTSGEAGDAVANIHLFGGGAATILTGVLVGMKPFTRDPRRVLYLMGTVIGIATVVSWFIYSTHSLELATALFWIFIPSIYFYIGPCFGLLNNLAEPRMRAVFCASTLFVANVGNLIIAPQVIGFLSDTFAPNGVTNAASLRLAMLCLVPTGLWATFHYFRAARDLVKDQERATGIKLGLPVS